MSKFTAAQLVAFYQKVADGGEIQFNHCHPTLDWYKADPNSGPTIGHYHTQWRIKPAKKIIDISHFIESGIDCEFSDDETWIMLAGLVEIDLGCKHPYTNIIGVRWKQCRPRMNHKMYHDGGECPLPEGFRVKVYRRYPEDISWTNTIANQKGWIHNAVDKDIIGYEIIGLADGWAYPWESDE